MIEKILLNKNNTSIYKDDELLYDVFDFNIKTDNKSLYLKEFLEEKPFEIIDSAKAYNIEIKCLMGDFIKNTEGTYNLRFSCEKNSLLFKNCKTVNSQIYTDNKGRLVNSLIINARECLND